MQKNWNQKLKFPDEYGTQLPYFFGFKKKIDNSVLRNVQDDFR